MHVFSGHIGARGRVSDPPLRARVGQAEAARMGDVLTQHSASCPPRLVVVWRINEACNLACGFCGYSREVVRPRASASADQVRALGASLAAYGHAQGRAVLASWLGGEPSWWRPLRGV